MGIVPPICVLLAAFGSPRDPERSADGAPTAQAGRGGSTQSSGSPAAANAQLPELERGFLFRELDFGGQRYAYTVFVPPAYEPGKRWPLILFLHGSGEAGEDGLRPTEVGIGRAIRMWPERCPAIVVFPQARPKQAWTGETAKLALACAERTMQQYVVDTDRLYLTGLSLGGAGSWLIGAATADRWAAVAPICGFGDASGVAGLKDVPLWAFHGDKDEAVAVGKSRELVDALRKAGGRPKYTEFAGVGHNCWDKAYADPEFWKWLLEQRRSARK